MSKSDQILVIEPALELKFIGLFSTVVTSELKLRNPSSVRVAFKVKTTAPKRYCVRPNSGLIEPSAEVIVSVMLQPFEYDPNEKNNHKFMVQSLRAPDATIESLDQLWKDAAAGELMDSKLRCVFELPAGGDAPVPRATDKTVEEVSITCSVKSTQLSPSEKTSVRSTAGVGSDEVKRVQAECCSLSSEIQRLHEENRKLHDDGMRLRKLASTPPASATQPVSSYGGVVVSADPSLLASQPPLVYLVAMLILGVFIGKFLL